MVRISERWHRYIFGALLLCVFHPQNNLHAQTPVFLGEDLVFYVSDSLCVMRGDYHFLNPSENPVKTRLFYPFPVSDTLPFPDRVDILSLESGARLPLLKAEKGVSFVLEIDPLSESGFHVEYWQAADRHAFEYILTSTQKWGRALEWATYEIHVPDHLRLEYCSVPWDTSWEEIETTVYSISKEQHLPKQNFVIRWGLKE